MTRGQRDQRDLLEGAPDRLILRSLLFGPRHGHSMAHTIRLTSGDALRVDLGSLHPSLRRLERRGRVAADRGTSENNPRGRSYRLTRAGKRRLTAESSKWGLLTEAIARLMRPREEEG